MSLILEALKKSEAERQLGRAPGLMSPTMRVSKRRGLSPWWGILGLAVLIVAAAAWYVNREAAGAGETHRATASGDDAATASEGRAPEPGETAASTTSAPDAGATSDREPVPPATSPTVVSSPATAASPTAANVNVPAASAEPPPDAADAPRPVDPDFVSVERESIPLPPPVATPSPAVPLPDALPSTVPPIAIDTPTAPTAVPPGAVAPEPSSASTTPDPTAAPAQPADAAPNEPPLEPLPTLGELLPDVRNALPTLKLSMHVYAAEPAARFVLIDGKRYAQGERLGPSLVLSEIRRDGAVLDFGGKRFVLPRP